MIVVAYTFEGVKRTNRCLYGEPPFDFNAYSHWLSTSN